MAIIDSLNSVVRSLIIGSYTPTKWDFLLFLLMFFLLYGIMFTATAYIPMFNPAEKKERFTNIRVVISLSVAFIGTINMFSMMIAYLQGITMIIMSSMLLLILLLAIIPKSLKDNKKVVGGLTILSIGGGIAATYYFYRGEDWVSTLTDLIVKWGQSFFANETLVIIGILTAIVVFVYSFASAANRS